MLVDNVGSGDGGDEDRFDGDRSKGCMTVKTQRFTTTPCRSFSSASRRESGQKSLPSQSEFLASFGSSPLFLS